MWAWHVGRAARVGCANLIAHKLVVIGQRLTQGSWRCGWHCVKLGNKHR